MTKVYAKPQKETLISEPNVLKIPIHKNHDDLVDLSKQTAINYEPSPEIKSFRLAISWYF